MYDSSNEVPRFLAPNLGSLGRAMLRRGMGSARFLISRRVYSVPQQADPFNQGYNKEVRRIQSCTSADTQPGAQCKASVTFASAYNVSALLVEVQQSDVAAHALYRKMILFSIQMPRLHGHVAILRGCQTNLKSISGPCTVTKNCGR